MASYCTLQPRRSAPIHHKQKEEIKEMIRPCDATGTIGAFRIPAAIPAFFPFDVPFHGLFLLLLLAFPWHTAALASGGEDMAPEMDLTELSIEELVEIDITSVSKKSQKLADAAAAIFVITSEDIRRSGATTIADLLRMVPGLQVARIDTNKWAVTARGFNGRLANKLLVLMDGRSVYSPLFSGVFWSIQDTLLEDIDRIEVIRGPGATLWGANAVNGVINIITKSAKDTRGNLVVAGAGTEERAFGAVRRGGSLGPDAAYRIFAKAFSRDESVDSSGSDYTDDWTGWRAGFRMDREAEGEDSVTLQGEIYTGDASDIITTPTFAPPFTETAEEGIDSFNANVLARWTHLLENRSEMTLQLYYDRTDYDIDLIEIRADTIDIDFLHRFGLGNRQEIVWGLGYRFIHDDIVGSDNIQFTSDSETTDIFSGFLQDEIAFLDKKLRLTIGSKFEYNDHTGFEIQPNARVAWTPGTGYSAWAAVSRAVRTPSRGEEDSRFNLAVAPAGPGTLLLASAFGNPDLSSEEVVAYEAGFRKRLTPRLSLDLALFFNDYRRLLDDRADGISFEMDPSPPHLLHTSHLETDMKAETWGVEIASEWMILDGWRLHGAYSYFQLSLDPVGDEKTPDESDPAHQVSLRSQMDLSKAVELDVWVRYVDDISDQEVDDYVALDVRLGWKPCAGVEISITGQNLLEDEHAEFVSEYFSIRPAEIERSFYGKITWVF